MKIVSVLMVLSGLVMVGVAKADLTNNFQLAADLNPPVLLIQADHPHAAPFVGDFDEDGKLDLLVGQFPRWGQGWAEVYAYRNLGSKEQPRFDQGQRLMADGFPISVPEFCVTGFGPQLVDLDGDGHKDLISGAPQGKIYIFKGLGGGRFGRATILELPDDKEHRHPFAYNIRPHFCDWDGDGDFDLLVGGGGRLWLLRNTGDSRSYRFEKAELLKLGGQPTMSLLTVPYLADWDGDGRPDLVLGSNDGSVSWCRNLASQGEPVLAPPQLLVPPGNYNARNPTNASIALGTLARICVADFNGDGRLDLLLGDASYESVSRPTFSAEEQAAAKKTNEIYGALSAEFQRLQKVPVGEIEAERRVREAALLARGDECAKAYCVMQKLARNTTIRHGAVWLFTRKK